MFQVVPFHITCFLDRLANIRLLICVINDVRLNFIFKHSSFKLVTALSFRIYFLLKYKYCYY